MQETSIISVGIDIGTTTTQLVFSALNLCNTAGPTQVPRYAITDRKVVYGSPVIFTPKKPAQGPLRGRIPESGAEQTVRMAADCIDEEALGRIVRAWYKDAGFSLEDVATGAVIITGESLKTPNARRTVMDLSDSLGDFVVATAGPRLESIIAGRGSGAAALSRKLGGTVLNVDIGGGTSNYAVFRNGEVMDTACLNVGGRLVETDGRGAVTRVHAPARIILEDLFGAIPADINENHLSAMTDRMADMLCDLALGMADPLARKLLQTPPLSAGLRYDAVMLSGGVGECCRQPGGDPYRFLDTGPLLAQAILRNPNMQRLPLTPPAATVQATVIGAGSWSLSLSGSTVWADQKAFPLRNIPVVTVPLSWPAVPEDLAAHIRTRIEYFDIAAGEEPFVLAFTHLAPSYAAVRYLSEGLARFFRPLGGMAVPVIVSLDEDMGKVLGMELKPELKGKELVVVDEVFLSEGDYLDLGKPLQIGGFVPLIIKSLAFSGEESG